MQKFKFPMEFLRVTQGEFSTYSHAGSMAIDFGGKDAGSDKLYCPCDMLVKRCRENANGELYLESTAPVLFADGTSDYARMICIHDSTFKVKVGDIIPQGQFFYQEGGMGSGNPHKFGTHVHIEAGKGKWKSTTQAKNAQGTYVIENQEHLYNMFILGKDVQILDGGGYKWIVDEEDSEQTSDLSGVYGLDVSHNNNVNLAELNDKAKFIMYRATIGSEKVDNNLDKFLNNTPSTVEKIGFYAANYFGSVKDAQDEADYLVKAIKDCGIAPTLPLFCDWEGFSYNYWAKQGVNFTPAQIQEMVEAFCERIKSYGYETGVYTNKDYWDNKFTQSFFDKHKDYKIWFANPGYDKPQRECYMWQYASDNASDYGINTVLDKDFLFEIKKEYISDSPVKLKIGPASSGDIHTISARLEALSISYMVDDDGYIYTMVAVSRGDQITICKWCEELQIAIVEDTAHEAQKPEIPEEPKEPEVIEPEPVEPTEPEIPKEDTTSEEPKEDNIPDEENKEDNKQEEKGPLPEEEPDDKNESWLILFLRWLIKILTKE